MKVRDEVRYAVEVSYPRLSHPNKDTVIYERRNHIFYAESDAQAKKKLHDHLEEKGVTFEQRFYPARSQGTPTAYPESYRVA